MIKVSSLLWSLLVGLIVTGVSYFYINSNGSHGFPFRFAQEATQSASAVLDAGTKGFVKISFSTWVFILDLLFWWLLFSILLVVVKNYVFDKD